MLLAVKRNMHFLWWGVMIRKVSTEIQYNAFFNPAILRKNSHSFTAAYLKETLSLEVTGYANNELYLTVIPPKKSCIDKWNFLMIGKEGILR